MDEGAWREAGDAAVPAPCAFEPALAAACVTCTAAVRRALAEREAIGCGSPAAQCRCAAFAALLRERAAFALGRTPNGAWPHAALRRLGCGGLAGLRACVDPAEGDVVRLVAAASARYGEFAQLPWQPIVAAVAATPTRRQGGARR